jgi:hypothetical protein
MWILRLKMRSVLFLLLLVLTACANEKSNPSSTSQSISHLTTFSVSAKVSDEPGLYSLSEALIRSRKLLAEEQPVQIELLSGTYYLEKSVVLGAEFSGTQAQPFTIKAAQNAEVMFSAGRLLSLNWLPHTGKVFRAKLESTNFDQLLINSQRGGHVSQQQI